MTEFTRYAIYYAPETGSGLARFGAAWLGWDNLAGAEIAHPEVDLPVNEITATPRKYGFHGTMKPPFRLADRMTAASLEQEIADLAAGMAPFEAPPLCLHALGQFLALVPSGSCQRLNGLAMACIRELDHFRAPPTGAELAKRRKANLSPEQDAHLVRWGYPYVMDQFRFHLTLSGTLGADMMARVKRALAPLAEPYCRDPLPVRDIALFGEVNGGRFHLIDRYALTG